MKTCNLGDLDEISPIPYVDLLYRTCQVSFVTFYFVVFLRAPQTCLFKGTSNTCRRVEHFGEIIHFVFQPFVRAFLLREWISFKPYLALASVDIHHSSSRLPWLLLAQPCSGVNFPFLPFPLLFILSFFTLLGLYYFYYMFSLLISYSPSIHSLPLWNLGKEPSHLDSLLS